MCYAVKMVCRDSGPLPMFLFPRVEPLEHSRNSATKLQGWIKLVATAIWRPEKKIW